MPIDPTVHAASLIASAQEISAVEHQNRFGIRHQIIKDLTSGKFVTVLAIQTPSAFSSEQFFEILSWLRNEHGVEAMQTAFAAEIPDYGMEYQNDLHLTAHLRAERPIDLPS